VIKSVFIVCVNKTIARLVFPPAWLIGRPKCRNLPKFLIQACST